MKKYMELPADYAVLSDDEMTYTTGGSAVGGVVTIVGVAVLASSYVWGISQARDWLSVDSNRGAILSPLWAVQWTPSATICPNRLPTSCVTLFLPVRWWLSLP